MSLTPAKLLRGLALLSILVAWAFLAHHGSTGESHPDLSTVLATAPLLAIVVMLLWRAGNPLWMALGGFGVLGLLAWAWPQLRENVALLYYVQHIGTNLALGTLFGRSLIGNRQALVTQFALMAHHGVISPAQARYTRQVTMAWTAFFFSTVAVSTVLFWLPLANAWSIFANLLAMPLIGLMFIVEHVCRHHLLPPEDRSSIADTIRGYRATMQQSGDRLAKLP